MASSGDFRSIFFSIGSIWLCLLKIFSGFMLEDPEHIRPDPFGRSPEGWIPVFYRLQNPVRNPFDRIFSRIEKTQKPEPLGMFIVQTPPAIGGQYRLSEDLSPRLRKVSGIRAFQRQFHYLLQMPFFHPDFLFDLFPVCQIGFPSH